jgi:hypothetical protein
MIGVATHPSEREAVTEFFELFKTPWEFYRSDQLYDVLICTHAQLPEDAAALVLLYNAQLTPFDTRNDVPIRSWRGGTSFSYAGESIPIYGNAATFPVNRFSALKQVETNEPAVFISGSHDRTVLRIGYNLFQEVGFLLGVGQPPVNAQVAALEMHIALLRNLITGSGIPLVEIPPVPGGHGFIACLTHDIDHPVLRNHWCDHTMFGFLYRATVGALVHVCRGRKPIKNLAINWVAACMLPFVYLGMARDFWGEFDRYVEIEAGLGATYFVIPKKDYSGRHPDGSDAAMRASRYEVADIKPQLERIISSGCEVGLHGIDAWLDGAEAGMERDRISQVSGVTDIGVRMHWLFFNDKSPAVLDRTGFSYDSTFGYNETVGYRAGTAQAYKPLGATHLLELPLLVMDTALFYPNYLNLSDANAEKVVWKVIDEVEQFGGALTINWHDRSIAPERLWDDFYFKLVGELKGRGAWFPTAAQAVSWFRQRRSAVLEAVHEENGTIKIKASVKRNPCLPGLRIRVYQPSTKSLWEAMPVKSATRFTDVNFDENLEMNITL